MGEEMSLRYGLAAPLWLIVANTANSTTVRLIAQFAAIFCAFAELIPALAADRMRKRAGRRNE